MNTRKDKLYYRGVLELDSPAIPDRYLPVIVQSLKKCLPVIRGESCNDREYLNKLLSNLKAETIDHNMYFHRSAPKQADLNHRLVEGIWIFVRSWCEKHLNFEITEACPISVVDKNKMRSKNAFGLFCYSLNHDYRKCEIQILDSILDNTEYFMITLLHEYMHYVHYSLVSPVDYFNCPKLFAEGFSEYGSRIFYEQSGYDIKPKLKKSWNTSYETGRKVVGQICSEGFGIDGFTNGFLRNVQENNPWKCLDYLFA